MRIAVLPFNAGPEAKPGLGRQIANFVADTLRATTDLEINSVNLLAQIDQDGQQKAAFVNVSDTLNEHAFLAPLFGDAGANMVVDGLYAVSGDEHSVTVRYFVKDSEEPKFQHTYTFNAKGVFAAIHHVVKDFAAQAGAVLPEALQGGLNFGTEDGQAFLDFLDGFDAFQYVQAANGQVANEFDPTLGFDALARALAADPDFLGPYEITLALARACGQYRIGTFEVAEAAINKAIESAPDDFRGFYALGELYQVVGVWNKSSDAYEKALSLHEKAKPTYAEEGRLDDWGPEQASLFSRIGTTQLAMGMPVNAELNFRKAIELEGDDKPSLDLLAGVLQNTNRGHEIPNLWKQQLDKLPESAELHAKYAISLFQAERQDDAIAAFEHAMEVLPTNESKLIVKRFYAPLLAQRGEHDRAMDFYEDCIDEAPNDVAVLWEYAQTLRAGDREFEVPQVLDQLLASNPEPNLRAEALAWKTEITEPKRAEAVRSADEKLGKDDFAGALKELKPLRNWLADYWKMWAVLAAAFNRTGQHDEAREAAERLIELYPGCEPAYVELMGALNALGRNEDAYNVMRYAATNMPQSLGIHVNLALAAKRAGHDEEAKAMARQIREAVGPNPDLDQVFSEIDAG